MGDKRRQEADLLARGVWSEVHCETKLKRYERNFMRKKLPEITRCDGVRPTDSEDIEYEQWNDASGRGSRKKII